MLMSGHAMLAREEKGHFSTTSKEATQCRGRGMTNFNFKCVIVIDAVADLRVLVRKTTRALCSLLVPLTLGASIYDVRTEAEGEGGLAQKKM